jgi:F0F1-type ATP synthase assembly protein I
MNINNAIRYFEGLLTLAVKKSEIKIYENFIGILSNLKNRDLTKEQLRCIEEELEYLKLKEISENRKKYLRKKLNEFLKYLKDEFALTTKGYYSSIGMSLGMVLGISIGASVFGAGSGVSTGLMFGMLIGSIIGRYMDSEAEKKNLVLKTKLQ